LTHINAVFAHLCIKARSFFVEGARRAVAIKKKEVERWTFEIRRDLVCPLLALSVISLRRKIR
jgi:hypothetical protein